MNKNLETRKMKFPNVVDVDMDKVDWKKVKNFLNGYDKIPQHITMPKKSNKG